MWLQHLIDIYWREGDSTVDWTHTSFCEGALDGTNPFSYRSCAEKPSYFPPRAMFVIYWAFVYIVNDSTGSYQGCRGLDDYLWCRLFLLVGCVNILLKVPDFDEFLHQVMQTLALFNGVVVIFIIGAPFVLVLSSRIYLDWLRPCEIQQVVDLWEESLIGEA